mgnify:CR=1 FL=1|jgi:hypothetical protein
MEGHVEPGVVIVNRSDLLEALKHLAPGVKGKNPAQFVIYTENNELHFRAGAISYYIPASGSFEGIGHMSGLIVKGLKAFVPETDEITLYQSEDRLSFGNSRFSCKWGVDEIPAIIKTPLNLSFIDTLALRYKYTPEEIQANGYTELFEKAEQQKKSDIMTAARALSSYQVSIPQIESLVEEAIIRTILGH